jgi:hypothetical protein
MSNMEDWQVFHAAEHENVSETYKIASPPDLTYWPQDDQVGFANWLYAHALVHDNERRALNL